MEGRENIESRVRTGHEGIQCDGKIVPLSKACVFQVLYFACVQSHILFLSSVSQCWQNIVETTVKTL